MATKVAKSAVQKRDMDVAATAKRKDGDDRMARDAKVRKEALHRVEGTKSLTSTPTSGQQRAQPAKRPPAPTTSQSQASQQSQAQVPKVDLASLMDSAWDTVEKRDDDKSKTQEDRNGKFRKSASTDEHRQSADKHRYEPRSELKHDSEGSPPNRAEIEAQKQRDAQQRSELVNKTNSIELQNQSNLRREFDERLSVMGHSEVTRRMDQYRSQMLSSFLKSEMGQPSGLTPSGAALAASRAETSSLLLESSQSDGLDIGASATSEPDSRGYQSFGKETESGDDVETDMDIDVDLS
ncbi:uncharacterized protein BJ171DRAFT_480612 [Polychytrium aggregatum]|uniref:uncharacterized protein n=1 Tax=Polychytrium aggregatum TaxID=110093 RepID=UPI0022FEFF3D|nr:uncharacterized protein BJ171DRAFT_480612 [Polychytrium aggregatum]KAI9193088.1 hypothetical protein BJ171DRAFT_480612 [Polychytrium aggregatum]